MSWFKSIFIFIVAINTHLIFQHDLFTFLDLSDDHILNYFLSELLSVTKRSSYKCNQIRVVGVK
jgi:hypothetical protein